MQAVNHFLLSSCTSFSFISPPLSFVLHVAVRVIPLKYKSGHVIPWFSIMLRIKSQVHTMIPRHTSSVLWPYLATFSLSVFSNHKSLLATPNTLTPHSSWASPLPTVFFLQISTWLTPSLHSSLCWNRTFSERTSVAIVSKRATLPPLVSVSLVCFSSSITLNSIT